MLTLTTGCQCQKLMLMTSQKVKSKFQQENRKVKELQLLIDLHLEGDRQGPGSKEDTLRAIELAGLN